MLFCAAQGWPPPPRLEWLQTTRTSARHMFAYVTNNCVTSTHGRLG
jgi:hypothetical protein